MTKSTTLFIHTIKKHPTFRALLHGDTGDDVPGSWVAFHQLSTHTLLKRFPWPQVLQYRDKKLKQMYLMDILERTEDVQLVEWFYRTYCPDEEITPDLVKLMFIRGMLNPLIRNLYAEGKLPVDRLRAMHIIREMANAPDGPLDGPTAAESCRFLLEEMGVPFPLRDQFSLLSIINPCSCTNRCKHIFNYLIAERRQIFPWSKFEFICKAGALAAVTFMLREFKYVSETSTSVNHYNVDAQIESNDEALQFIELCQLLDDIAGKFPPIHVNGSNWNRNSTILDTALNYIHVPGMREIVKKLIYTCTMTHTAAAMYDKIMRHGDIELLELTSACYYAQVEELSTLKVALTTQAMNRDIVRLIWDSLRLQEYNFGCSISYVTLEPYCHKTLPRDMIWDVYDLTMQHGKWNKAVFQLIYDKYRVLPSISAIFHSGKLELVQWMYESGFVEQEDAACVFISARDVEITKYTYAKAKAATGNKIEILVWDERGLNPPSGLIAPRAWRTLDMNVMTRSVSYFIHECQESSDALKSWEFMFGIPECRQLVQDTIYRSVENVRPDSSSHWHFQTFFIATFMNSYKAFREIFDRRFELWPTRAQWMHSIQHSDGFNKASAWTGNVLHLGAIITFYWDESEEMKQCIADVFKRYCKVGIHLDIVRYLLDRFPDFLSLTAIQADVADNVLDAFMT